MLWHGREKNDKVPQLVITFGQAQAGVAGAMFVADSVPTEVDPESGYEETEAVEPIAIYLPIISQ
jgi:hypothetical protein